MLRKRYVIQGRIASDAGLYLNAILRHKNFPEEA
jgi:hypothetical protein